MSEPLDVTTGYNRWSAVYDEERNPLVALEEPLVRGWIQNPRGLTIADIGCGTGRHTVWLARAGAIVHGFDGSSGMLDKARAKTAGCDVTLHNHALPAPLPAPDASFDLTILALVADHITDLATMFRDMHRITVPDGEAIFTVMHPAMNLKGVIARFIDPERGERVTVESCRHTCSDYVMAAIEGRWRIAEMVERCADSELAATVPRAEKYIDWPMLLAMRLQRQA